ncbi:DNA polymerase I, thermostable [Clostridium ljungdahlii DSM 13528]|uniref:DNA-directed DNA polymerase n=1 Tax=Clostridium ljungdahlii (strain ATCC 55383 / DSM 13528 / PETC) TaxID=748727 RepID=D8GT97_CLOLD|nr:DNA polymerase [Clostridium ljungdahlii]ADK16696.1 phage related DNA polymerase [Clostridium ljungdahlii DSM 13528]OAA89430.1 DNA polymerase I, thermostable [Clostridium ljungdahlii DSM 13528]
MDTLAIDVETYCELDIKKVGAYKYCEHPSFQILLFAYAFNDEPVEVIDFAQGEELPQKVKTALLNPGILKTAFNANFEINALKKYLINGIDAEDWQCTMVQSLILGLPGSLDMVGKVLRFEEDKQKMKEGKALIQYFCKPCKPTKSNGGRTRNLPEHAPEKWEIFKKYNKQDVEVERAIRNKLNRYPTTENEQRLWELDQCINDRGVGADIELIEKAIECNNSYNKRLTKEATELTGLSNPNSPTQLKRWIGERVGHEVKSLTKDSIPTLIKESKDEKVKKILELRQLMAKTSIKKYETMQRARCEDGRMRGLLQFYGANRTGRWAGRLVQVQNLPQNHLPDLDDARNFIRTGQFDKVEFLYDSIPDTLSQLIRTAFIPKEGNRFIVADFSAIEARVIAWYAGEQWRLDVFNNNGDIYCASASKMFKVPVEKHGINGHLRQKGKIAELALGYGGSVGALMSMDKKKNIPEDELPGLVKDWRDASPHITKFWWDVDKAAKKAIRERTTVVLQFGLKFIYDPGVLFIQLPSGRKLAYIRPKIEPGPYDKPIITYEGLQQTSKQWTTLETYGPKIVENIVQATARDCLGITMQRVEDKGFHIVMHVHDELICDVPKGKGTVEEICDIFGEPIEWAPGLPLKADGYECNYYMKD